jgi:phosphoribosylanthranilate isomerase
MKLKIKVCGMREPSNIEAVAKLNVDFMGFIYYEKSPRFVGNDFEAPSTGEKIQRVGVFVNQPLHFIFKEVERNSLDAVQLHGSESPEVCCNLKSKGITVIKVFSIGDDFDFVLTKPYQYAADYFLFDTKGMSYGGTGKKFDWGLLEKYSQPTPFFLSGGLSPENIAKVSNVKNPQLYGVDLNSGVEESAGVKSVERIKQIVELFEKKK